MIKKRDSILCRLVLLLMFFFSFLLPTTTLMADAVPNYGGTFYEDVPEAMSNPLRAAGYFHIFAKKAELRNRTNGNVATNYLSGTADFGTKNIATKEYHYIQNFNSINATSGIKNQTKMIFGTPVSIDFSNYYRPKVNNISLDNVSGDNVFQDVDGDANYLNLDQEFLGLISYSSELANQTNDIYVKNSDFVDQNKRIIDVSGINKQQVYVRLSSDVLRSNTPLIIKGLEKKKEQMNFKNVFIIVETNASNSYQIASPIQFQYTDGSIRGNKETTDFSDSTVLWNFVNQNVAYGGRIDITSTWLGSILAPKATLNSSESIDGNIIVDTFEGAGETHRWDWQQTQKKYRVNLLKVDGTDTSKVLSGAEFNLYTSDGELVKSGLMTDKNGTISYENLSLGSYYFEETKAPVGYQLTKDKYVFEIKAERGDKAFELTVKNDELPPVEILGKVKLLKVDGKNTSKNLSGAEFSLYTSGGELVESSLVTDKNGTISYENLSLGSYYFEETKAPVGYQLTKDKYVFEIKAEHEKKTLELTVKNTQAPPVAVLGKVKLLKVDSKDTSKVLPGAEFSLYTSGGKLIKFGLVTDKNGVISYEGLSLGSYYFEETKAPTGYQLTKGKSAFELKAEHEKKALELTVKNTQAPPVAVLGKVKLLKVDSKDTSKVLSGAEFSLYTSGGKLVKSGLVTDKNGTINYEGLSLGSYYFEETKAPTGYQLTKGKSAFELKAEHEKKALEITVKNTQAPPVAVLGKVKLLKVDSKDTSKVLPGAEFSLYTSGGKLVKPGLVTDKNGVISYEGLSLGSYYFEETKAPTGYQLMKGKYSFEIKEEHGTRALGITVKNEQKKSGNTNKKDGKLPQTNEASDLPLILVGIFIVLLVILLFIYLRNNKKTHS